MGADGKLPALVLHDVDQALEAAVAHPKTSPPWLLLVVFGFSVTMSLAMLFIDSGNSTQVERRSRTAARAALQQNYTGTYPPLAPYQQKIRRRCKLTKQGDRAEEKRLFREVLDILHAESKNRSTGVDGDDRRAGPARGECERSAPRRTHFHFAQRLTTAAGICRMEPHLRFEILQQIAAGDFATVYRARDRELGREVAIKQIHPQFLHDPRQLERYWQEAQLLASLRAPAHRDDLRHRARPRLADRWN